MGHHRYIYNEQLHVPLLFHFSDADALGMAQRDVDDQLVEHVDLTSHEEPGGWSRYPY